MRPVRFEKLEHTAVGGPGFTGQGPGHGVGEVIIAHRHGVRVAQRLRNDEGRAPWAYAGDGLQPPVGIE